jgi:GT2 family glycosyltransferase
MTISVMITTRDRCHDLRITCSKLMELRPLPDEVIIWSDGCTDGTAAMVRTDFSGFQLIESTRRMGSVFGRDRMLRLARGDIVVSLDDDSHPVQRDFLIRLRKVMEQHPEAAVVSFAELREGGEYAGLDKTESSRGHYVSAYANCAAAMRREFYLAQPGFVPFFGHMYEEPDYTLQCYAAGAAAWFEPTLVVRHRQSGVNRAAMARHQQNARNELWSVWLRCPWPWVPVISAYRIARQFVYGCSEGARWALAEPCWWAAALKGVARCWRQRRPIAWPVYAQWMRLARSRVYSTAELKRRFPTSVTGAKIVRPGERKCAKPDMPAASVQ